MPAKASTSACRRSPIRSALAPPLLRPLYALIERHVLAAERLHGDDTTVPILAKGQTVTGRVWVYVRDDRPFGGKDPPAALFYASRDRTREHPERHLAGYTGILQADAFDGYNRLYLPDRKPGPIVEALCWSHARRKFFELADIAASARRRQDGDADLADRIRGRQTHRRAVRHRARDQRPVGCRSLGCAPGEKRPVGRRARRLDARRARQTLPSRCRRQGHRLHAHALAGLHPLPRRRPHLSHKQCRKSAPCAASPWAGSHGSSQDRSAARNEPHSCTR